MTNEELIRMFRNDPTWMGKDIADRIETLLAERDALKAEVERLKAEVFETKLDRLYVLGFNAGWDECEKQVDEVWNEAIEAAAAVATSDGCDFTASLIVSLKRPVKGDDHFVGSNNMVQPEDKGESHE